MIAIALALLVSRRAVGAFQVLAATLLAAVVWDPFAPLSASFWLSFVAVGILLALSASRRLKRPAETHVRRAARVAVDIGALQWSIGCALLPLTAVFFGEIRPWAARISSPSRCSTRARLTLLATLPPVDGWPQRSTPPPHGRLARGRDVAALHALASEPFAALRCPRCRRHRRARGAASRSRCLRIRRAPARLARRAADARPRRPPGPGRRARRVPTSVRVAVEA
jgi:hypothetical protein